MKQTFPEAFASALTAGVQGLTFGIQGLGGLYSLPDDNGSVWWLAWSADSGKLAVSRSNGEISVWKLPEIERVLAGLGLNP